jgi:hypothetical protein
MILMLAPLIHCSPEKGNQSENLQVKVATYLGGNGWDDGRGIGVDSLGNIYICGNTSSANLPLKNAIQEKFGGDPDDIYLAKFNPAADSIIFATYIGGSKRDECKAFEVDSEGNAYITGRTNSPDFPVTENAFGKQLSKTYDIIVLKISPRGKILYANIFGGESMEEARGLGIDGQGNCVVAGGTHSTDFPTTEGSYCPVYNDTREPDPLNGPFQAEDVFVAKINADGSRMIYCTFLGGKGHDKAWATSATKDGRAIIAGYTRCPDFPVTEYAIQKEYQGNQDGFLTVLSSDGRELEYSTYIGGKKHDKAAGVDYDNNGNIWIGGHTNSKSIFTDKRQFYSTDTDNSDIFLMKVKPQESVPLFTTLIGGDENDNLSSDGLDVNSNNNLILTGNTNSQNFPVLNYDVPIVLQSKNCIAVKYNCSENKMIYAFSFGGSKAESGKSVCVSKREVDHYIGTSNSDDFPLKEGAFQNKKQHGDDMIIFTMDRKL